MGRECEKVERLISDRLDGEISPADALTLQAHLNRCEECRQFEESSRLCRERLRSLPDVAVDTPTQYSSERTKGTNRFWVKRISLRIPVAAVLAVLMLTGWILALLPSGKSIETSPSHPILVKSVEVIKAQPAQVFSAKADPDNSPKTKRDEI